MGLPMVGEKPSLCFGNKRSDKALVAQVCAEYNLQRGKQGPLFKDIQDQSILFGAQIIAGKLLRHQCPDQGSAGCILAAKKCADGVSMSW